MYRLDPSKITKYNCNVSDLELRILFWLLAQGKNGTIAARNLDVFLSKLAAIFSNLSPFILIKKLGEKDIPLLMQECGIGCYNLKSKTIWRLVNSGIDLRSCSCYDLEQIKGIGRKTSRGFILHTRENVKYAVIDRHLLHYLRDVGYNTPLSTPASKNLYESIEKIFLDIVPFGFSISEFDNLIWNIYKRTNHGLS